MSLLSHTKWKIKVVSAFSDHYTLHRLASLLLFTFLFYFYNTILMTKIRCFCYSTTYIYNRKNILKRQYRLCKRWYFNEICEKIFIKKVRKYERWINIPKPCSKGSKSQCHGSKSSKTALHDNWSCFQEGESKSEKKLRINWGVDWR